MNTLARLQQWFCESCDGSWEHGQGIEIETLDNPGWSVTIGVSETRVADKEFESMKIERSEFDWVHARIESGRFVGIGGPENLSEILELFLKWASPSEEPEVHR